MSLIRVTVQDPAGQPVANARVFFESGPKPLTDIASLSNEHGEVVLGVTATGDYGLACAADGFRTGHASCSMSGGDDATSVVVVLDRS